MTCLEAFEYISRALDNDLNEEEMAMLEEHIDQCDSCRKEYEDMKAIYIDLKNEKQYDLPPSFHEDLMKKINDSKVVAFKASAKKSYYKKYAALAASFVVLAVVGVSSNDMFGVRKNEAAMPMAMPSAAADMTVAEECAPAEMTPKMMMARIEPTEAGAGIQMAEEEAVITESAMFDGAEEVVEAYNGEMANIIAIECEDPDAVLNVLEEYAQENGFNVGIGGNTISIYADRYISAEVKEILGGMVHMIEDDAIDGMEYNVVEIEIR